MPLGPTDFRLLLALVESAGAVVTKDDLMSRVWGRASVGDYMLYVHINALRKVIGDDCIINKKGYGYRFAAHVERREWSAPQRVPSRTGNLPALWATATTEGPTRLIGRTEHLRGLSDLLAHSRLVALTGPGGVGKTRLALHAAGEASTHLPDGAWLVELAGVNNGDLVAGTVASALGVRVGVHATPLDTLSRQLAQKSLLIVLDNCEHVLAASAQIAEALLAAAPGVKILATSREPLSCTAEQIWEVPPLAVPNDGTMAADQMRSMAAVAFFIERAKEADATFRIVDTELPLVAKICRRVDGLPLAIEMVAGWAGVLGLETLDAKLDGSLNAWLRARSTAPPRHSTLRATLEWSHALLSQAEQTVLCRLPVFAGGFTIEAAEAVAGGDPIPTEQVFEHVASLARKSMIAIVPGARTRRYRLLGTTRALLLEKLEATGNGNAARRKHAHHMIDVLERAKVEWETTSDAIWLERHAPLVDDLRAAFDWTMGVDSDEAVALAGASWPLLRELSLAAEARKQLTAAAARLHSGTPPVLEARLRHGLGVTLLNTPAMAAAHHELQRTVTIYRSLGDTLYLGTSLIPLGYSLVKSDRIKEAELAITEALGLLESSGWLRTLATGWYVKMHIEAALGCFDGANIAQENAARLCELAGAERAALNVAADFVQVTLEKGDIDAAISAGRGIVARLRETQHSDIRGFALGVLSAALVARGKLEEALAMTRDAAPLLRDDGRLFWLFDHLALCAALSGRTKDAALIAGYVNAVHEKSGRPRERMGRDAMSQTNLLLHDALREEEIVQLNGLGTQLSEEQALTIALTG